LADREKFEVVLFLVRDASTWREQAGKDCHRENAKRVKRKLGANPRE